MKIGQRYPEVWGHWLGLVRTEWNVSVSAIVTGDTEQRWRYFGVTLRGRRFGVMVQS